MRTHPIISTMIQKIITDYCSSGNLAMPGHPRYQPKELVAYYGYDNLFRWLAIVEVANLIAMATKTDIGCPLITNEEALVLLEISTTEVDVVERKITQHDIRAWVQLAQKKCPRLSEWIHLFLTSYDALDTARSLQFKLAYENVLKDKITTLIGLFGDVIEKHIEVPQIGRSHGQHAIPITVGFWLATILNRITSNYQKMDECAKDLKGKISGAVGAYNAQALLGLPINYEEEVLSLIGLEPALISTQILPPEPMAYYLFSCMMLSMALGQFSEDCRQLTRSEILEITEPFDSTQVGSSTMAHKRNPINFENTQGQGLKNKIQIMLVLETLISEHQRDLTGSSIYRDFPMIVINLTCQLNNFLRAKKDKPPFISSIFFNENQMMKNLQLSGDSIMAEPLYILLQIYGYEGDAHDFVNHTLIKRVKDNESSLYNEFLKESEVNENIMNALKNIPEEILLVLQDPSRYIGRAVEKAQEIVDFSREIIAH